MGPDLTPAERRVIELTAFDLEVLLHVFRVQQGRSVPIPWPGSREDEAAEAMWRLRAARLMGWKDGRPYGLTRAGALRGHELDRARTRERQVRDYLADEQARLERLRARLQEALAPDYKHEEGLGGSALPR